MLLRVSENNSTLGQPKDARRDAADRTGKHDVPSIAVLDIALDAGGVDGEPNHAKHKGPFQSNLGNQVTAKCTDDDLETEDDCIGCIYVVWIGRTSPFMAARNPGAMNAQIVTTDTLNRKNQKKKRKTIMTRQKELGLILQHLQDDPEKLALSNNITTARAVSTPMSPLSTVAPIVRDAAAAAETISAGLKVERSVSFERSNTLLTLPTLR